MDLSLRALERVSSWLDFWTSQPTMAPRRMGLLSSMGRYMPRAKARAEMPSMETITAMTAPDAVEHPGHVLPAHEGVGHGGHGAGLRGRERVGVLGGRRAVAVDSREEHDDRRHREAGEGRAEDVAPLDGPGRGAQPVADLELGDEGAGHGEGRADHAADEEDGEHPRRALEAEGRQGHGGDDEGRQGHARDGRDRNHGHGPRGDGREEEDDEEGEDQRDAAPAGRRWAGPPRPRPRSRRRWPRPGRWPGRRRWSSSCPGPGARSCADCSCFLKSWARTCWRACLMTGDILRMEMTPAAKMPPMPMFRTPGRSWCPPSSLMPKKISR